MHRTYRRITVSARNSYSGQAQNWFAFEMPWGMMVRNTETVNISTTGPNVIQKIPISQPCPCGAKKLFAQCCHPLLAGAKKAVTAEALMRSRYSGYVTGNTEYLIQTWHSSTRPSFLDTEAMPAWCQLEIIRTEQGREDDSTGIVAFKATGLSGRKKILLQETSQFIKENKQWFYIDGVQEEVVENNIVSGKIGRNSPCPCGSGKKFKKCCA